MAQILPIDLTDQPIAEGATRRLRFTVVDEDSAAMDGTQVTALTYTLFAERNAAVINGREDVDILSLLQPDGSVTLILEEEDNVIVSPQPHVRYEYHVLLFEWAYSLGTKAGKQTVRLKVVNLPHVS